MDKKELRGHIYQILQDDLKVEVSREFRMPHALKAGPSQFLVVSLKLGDEVLSKSEIKEKRK